MGLPELRSRRFEYKPGRRCTTGEEGFPYKVYSVLMPVFISHPLPTADMAYSVAPQVLFLPGFKVTVVNSISGGILPALMSAHNGREWFGASSCTSVADLTESDCSKYKCPSGRIQGDANGQRQLLCAESLCTRSTISTDASIHGRQHAGCGEFKAHDSSMRGFQGVPLQHQPVRRDQTAAKLYSPYTRYTHVFELK